MLETKRIYLNKFHKKTTERKLEKLKKLKENPIPASEALETQLRMHEEIKKKYPTKKYN